MADLIDWDGDTDDPHWEHFIAAVRATLSGEPVAGLEKPVKKKSLWPVLALATLGLLAAGGVVAFGMGMLDSILGRGAPAASGPIGAVVGGPTPPRQPSEAEKTMFAKAQDSRLKTDYQDYLRSFPQGAYAKQIREEILPICAGEMQKVWKPPQMPLGQMFRSASVTDGPGDVEITYDNKAAACSSAQDAFKASADSYCLAFTNSLETRNREVGYTIQDCVCQEAGGNWWCYTDSTYSCTYEFQTEQYVEVCG
ncbi:MAG: toll/interleukin-1 receptor domain-containing protein, partial [Pseudomonadota bacterium]